MRNNSLITAIVVGIVGLLLIIFEGRGDLLTWIVIAIGVMFILPGAFVLLSQLTGDKSQRKGSAIVAAVGCLCLGVILCVIPDVFVSILIYLFAFVLIVGGIAQMVSLSNFKMPGGLYVIPALVAVAGVVMVFAGAEKDASVIVLVTGIAMVLYSINSFVEYYRMSKLVKS